MHTNGWPTLTTGLGAYIFGNGPDPVFFNCSGHTHEEWLAMGSKQPVHGWVLIITGIIFMFITALSLVIMYAKGLTQHPCYKIMFTLGIFEMLCITTANFTPGIIYIYGITACSHMDFQYINGDVAIGFYGATCWCLIMLAINRLAAVRSGSKLALIFDTNNVSYILLGAVPWGTIIAITQAPCFFDTNALAYLWNPGIYPHSTPIHYDAYLHSFNNVLAGCIIVPVYIYIAIATRRKALNSSKFQRQVLIQSAVICALNGGTELFYVVLQIPFVYTHAPSYIGFVVHNIWVCSNAASGIMYVTVNSMIRDVIIQYIRKTPLRRLVPSGWKESSAIVHPQNLSATLA